MELSKDQKLWLLTAHPDTWDLVEAPDWLVIECYKLGLIRPGREPGLWRKSEIGHQATEAI